MIELLVSLAIYLVAMTAVVALIGLSGNFLQSYSKEYASEASGMMAFQTLESVLRSSYEVSGNQDTGITAKLLNGNSVLVSVDSNVLLVRETGPGGFVRQKKMALLGAGKITLLVLGGYGRAALLARAEFSRGTREKLLLASYQKKIAGL